MKTETIERRIILNRIQTPDGTILTSHHRHDYVTHTDKNGEEYMRDGGGEYIRSSVNTIPYKDLSVYSDAPYGIIRESYHRGGRGKDGTEPLKWVPMSEMSNDWLASCITYNNARGLTNCFANTMYKKELDYRKKHEILIAD